jgi:DNA invertase Pin-like site-specific DNA recombinase
MVYARESADCSLSIHQQVACLRAVAIEQDWTVCKVFTDGPTSARKSRERRPGETGLVETIRRGDVEKVLVHSVDRVGRSLTDLIVFVEVCRAEGVSLYLHEQGIDTATSNGLTLFYVAAMLALHVRQSRRDRILSGQAAARAASVRFGRPRIAETKIEKAKRGLAEGKGVRGAARFAGISAASVSRLKSAPEPGISY